MNHVGLQCAHRLHKVRTYYYRTSEGPGRAPHFSFAVEEWGALPGPSFGWMVVVCADLVKSMSALQIVGFEGILHYHIGHGRCVCKEKIIKLTILLIKLINNFKLPKIEMRDTRI